jgi:integrase
MPFAISITRRRRRRILASGIAVVHVRYVLNFRDPRSRKRRQLFFKTHKEAIAKRDALLASVAIDTYDSGPVRLTVGQAVEHWLENRQPEVKASTWKTYWQVSGNCIVGPLLIGTPAERKAYCETGKRPEGARLVEMLGPVKIGGLTTGDIRKWHRTLQAEVGNRTANMAKTLLGVAVGRDDPGIETAAPAR